MWRAVCRVCPECRGPFRRNWRLLCCSTPIAGFEDGVNCLHCCGVPPQQLTQHLAGTLQGGNEACSELLGLHNFNVVLQNLGGSLQGCRDGGEGVCCAWVWSQEVQV